MAFVNMSDTSDIDSGGEVDFSGGRSINDADFYWNSSEDDDPQVSGMQAIKKAKNELERDRRLHLSLLFEFLQKVISNKNKIVPPAWSRISTVQKAEEVCKELTEQETLLRVELDILLQEHWILKRRFANVTSRNGKTYSSANLAERLSSVKINQPIVLESKQDITNISKKDDVPPAIKVPDKIIEPKIKTNDHKVNEEAIRHRRRKFNKRPGLSEEEKEFHKMEEKYEDLLSEIDALWDEVKDEEEFTDEEDFKGEIKVKPLQTGLIKPTSTEGKKMSNSKGSAVSLGNVKNNSTAFKECNVNDNIVDLTIGIEDNLKNTKEHVLPKDKNMVGKIKKPVPVSKSSSKQKRTHLREILKHNMSLTRNSLKSHLLPAAVSNKSRPSQNLPLLKRSGKYIVVPKSIAPVPSGMYKSVLEKQGSPEVEKEVNNVKTVTEASQNIVAEVDNPTNSSNNERPFRISVTDITKLMEPRIVEQEKYTAFIEQKNIKPTFMVDLKALNESSDEDSPRLVIDEGASSALSKTKDDYMEALEAVDNLCMELIGEKASPAPNESRSDSAVIYID